jgi:hypothetical protein
MAGRRKGLLSLLLIAAVSGCGEGEADYFPLEEGWTWGYRIMVNSQGVGRNTYRSFVSNLPPQPLADITATPRIVHDGRVYYDAEEAGGIRRIAHREPGKTVAGAAPGHYVLKYPLEPGTSWRVGTRTQLLRRQVITRESVGVAALVAEVELDYRVEAVDDVVTVPAGVFKGCLRVRGAGRIDYDTESRLGVITIEVSTTEWFAPGVGLVKLVRTERSFPENPVSGELVKELEVLDRGSWLG